MCLQSHLLTLVVTLALLATLTQADDSDNSIKDNLCKESAQLERLCGDCAEVYEYIDVAECCSSTDTQKQCVGVSWRTKREISASDGDSLYNTLNNLRISGRTKPFLGKRSPRYMLGKRPRNNFLGKRDDSGDLADAIPLLDYLEEQSDKRSRPFPFLGKKARPFLGKRSSDYPVFMDNEDDFLADKRDRRPFLGKRMRPMLGKRGGSRPFLGKRDFEDDATLIYDGLADEASKRGRMPFLGKRGRRPMLGKREFEEIMGSQDIKRAARYMLGKREDDMEMVQR